MCENEKIPTKQEILDQMTPEGRKRFAKLLEPIDEEAAKRAIEGLKEVEEGMELAGKVDEELLKLQFSV